MTKSLKLNDEQYWDTTGIVHDKEKLNELLNSFSTKLNELENGIYYKDGDSLSLNVQDVILGYITSGSTQVILTIITPKNMKNVKPVLEFFSMQARGINGYLNGSNAEIKNNTSGYSFGLAKVSDTVLRIIITKSTVFTNVTNNTPVSGNMNYTISFEKA